MGKILRIRNILIMLVMIIHLIYSQVTIDQISGELLHNSTITISGSGFGVKSPAKPLWWDDGEGATHGLRSLGSGELSWVTSTLTGDNKHYNDIWPTGLTGVWDSLNIMYRHPIRGVSAPHPYSTRYIAGSHAPQDSCAGGNVARNVLINISDGVISNDWYISYYLRLDPLWPTSLNTENNYKFFVWERTPPYRAYQGSGFLYDNWPGCGDTPTTSNYASFRRSPSCDASWVCGVVYWEFDAATTARAQQYPLDGFPWITHDTLALNPKFSWVKSEHIARFSNAHATSIDKHLHNNVALVDIELDPLHQANIRGVGEVGGITIGGFLRIATCENGNDIIDRDAWRYFDDVYIDKTFSRVVLGDAGNYSSCAILELQIPQMWSDNSITCKVNLGKLSENQDIYLYVFDANNVHNGAGFLIGSERPSQPQRIEVRP